MAKSKGCPRQAFSYGDRVYGFQFYMEMTSELVAEMIEHCAEDLSPGKYVRSKAELSSSDYKPITDKMLMLLDHLSLLGR